MSGKDDNNNSLPPENPPSISSEEGVSQHTIHINLPEDQSVYDFLIENGGWESDADVEAFYAEADEELADQYFDSIPYPSEIKKHLDSYVVGQHQAKRAISVSIINHLYRTCYNSLRANENQKIKKSNVLLIGDSGVGKSYIVETAAKYAGLPFVSIDSTQFSASGYVGGDVEDILTRLIEAARGKVEDAEVGIVFIDEFDKLAGHGNKDQEVNTVQVQYAMLKMIEGVKMAVPETFEQRSKLVDIDTSEILFIFAGAFGGLHSSSKENIGKGDFGFNKSAKNHTSGIKEEQILKYGIIPEILGRIGNFVELDTLTDDDLMQILTKVRNNPVEQAKRLFKLRFPKKRFPLKKETFHDIIKVARESKLGARGLAREVNKRMMEFYYE